MKKFILIILGILAGGQVIAQQDPMLSQYMFNGLFLNPAYAGSHKYWSSTMTYRKQWVGMSGAPETAIAAVDGPIGGRNMGLGVSFMYDHIGVSTHNKITANYSYQIRTSVNSKLALGVSASLSQFNGRLEDLVIWDQGDQVFSQNVNGKYIPSFGVGAYYFSERYYIGISVPTLFAYQNDYNFNFDLSKSSFLRRHYLLTGGYVFTCSPTVKIKPSVLLKYVANAPLEADINFAVYYKNMISAGVSYRTNDAVVFLVEYQANSFFRIGYAYDLTTTALSRYTSGTHEIMFGIDFGRDLVKVKTPRYF
ncbi:type IX secretion system membrane protein PorP/SprF [Fluviicola sp.]|uniref:PorP/SprF family type IX secretion system membrane protein n=1 Tax=Fluviicola sp. TaxID=1917219 RepID=UPI002610F5E2|nr:type IX secretion system membrane protein PorP/SprF [Fluviicola sp.]